MSSRSSEKGHRKAFVAVVTASILAAITVPASAIRHDTRRIINEICYAPTGEHDAGLEII